MSDAPNPNYGHPVWHDLTIPEPETTRDFYSEVLGWTSSDVDMGGYSDYMMTAPDGTGVGGVVHAQGVNSEMPPVWMVYFLVPNLTDALNTVESNGGEVLKSPSRAGSGQYAVIRDPAGAVCGLYETD